jgi:hypothetical protein
VRIEDIAAWSKIDQNLTRAEFMLTRQQEKTAIPEQFGASMPITAEPGAAVFFRSIVRKAKLME